MEFEESIKHFNSDFHVSSSSEQFLSQYEDAKTILLQRNDDFNSMYSGWGLLENSFILVTMYTYQMKFAGSYIPTPKALRKRNALVNIKNECNRCFLYCVLYHFYSSKILNKKDKTKAESYDQFMKNFNYGDLKFPFNLNDICKFEKLNTESDISINVYSYKSSLNFEVVKLCEEEKRNHIDLLLLENSYGKFHYVYNSNLSALVHKRLTKNKSKLFICRKCLSHFSIERSYTLHSL